MIGDFTPNGVSLMDCAIVNEKLITDIIGFVSPSINWCWHCLESFILKSGIYVKPKKSNAKLDPLPISFKWNKISKIKFLDEMSSQNEVNHLDVTSVLY